MRPSRERCNHVLDAKVEIELPCRDILRVVPILIRQGEPDLNDLEQVDIASHRLVMVVRGCLEGAYWTSHNAWKFGVLRLA